MKGVERRGIVKHYQINSLLLKGLAKLNNIPKVQFSQTPNKKHIEKMKEVGQQSPIMRNRAKNSLVLKESLDNKCGIYSKIRTLLKNTKH